MGTFRRLVIDAYNLSRLVFLHGQKHIECFRVHTALAVDLYMHAVDEENRIVCFQTAGSCKSKEIRRLSFYLSSDTLLGTLSLYKYMKIN